MIRNYLLILFRNLRRNKAFIFVNVLGMAVAIACCIVAWFNWQFSANFDSNHVNRKVIYRVQAWQRAHGEHNRFAVVPNALAGMVRQNIADVDEVVRYTTAQGNVRIGDEIFSTSISYADPAFFDLFTFTTRSGTLSLKDRSTILISDELARKYFDREDVVGLTITQVNQDELKEYTIGGVFEKQPLNSSFGFEAITLWDNYWDTTPDRIVRDDSWEVSSTLFLRIEDPRRVDAITKQLQRYIEPQNLAREDFQISEYYLQNFETLAADFFGDTWLSGEQLRWGFPPSAVLGPGIMAVFLLLLACFNFTNTSMAVSGRRLREIGIRKTMGGRRAQLIAQFLGESLVLCSAALALGMVLAEFLAPLYNSMWDGIELSIHYLDNPGFIAFLAGLVILTAIIGGSYPAFYVSSFRPVAILKGKLKFGGTTGLTRVLLTLQFAISVLCIVAAIAYLRNAMYQRDYDLGYATNGVILAPVSGVNEFEAFRNELATDRRVQNIAGSGGHVSDYYYRIPVKYESAEHFVETIGIGDGYLEAMDIDVVEGRGFSVDSETDRKESVLVSKEFVRKFGWTDNPIGKRIVVADTLALYVVGVVNDIYTDGFWKQVAPVMLRYVAPEDYRYLVAKASPGNLLAVNSAMKAAWKKVSPNTLYEGIPYDRNLRTSETINGNVVKVFSFLGAIAILMSATGLFAMVSLNIIRKMKEIGVRKVFGASAANVMRVVGLEFLIIMAVASVLGGVLGFVATDSMMDAIWEYYRRIDALTLLAAAGLLFAVAILSAGHKVLSALRVNPVHILRDE